VGGNEVISNGQATSGVSPGLPTLETGRLLMRPLRPSDALDLARLAGRSEIADTTLSIPPPHPEDQAREWIAAHFAEDGAKAVVFALCLKGDGRFIGTIGLRGINRGHSHAEMGF